MNKVGPLPDLGPDIIPVVNKAAFALWRRIDDNNWQAIWKANNAKGLVEDENLASLPVVVNEFKKIRFSLDRLFSFFSEKKEKNITTPDGTKVIAVNNQARKALLLWSKRSIDLQTEIHSRIGKEIAIIVLGAQIILLDKAMKHPMPILKPALEIANKQITTPEKKPKRQYQRKAVTKEKRQSDATPNPDIELEETKIIEPTVVFNTERKLQSSSEEPEREKILRVMHNAARQRPRHHSLTEYDSDNHDWPYSDKEDLPFRSRGMQIWTKDLS